MNSPIHPLEQKQTILKIAIFSFFTIVVWIGFSVFESQQKTGIDPALLKLAIPLNPVINIDVINQIQQKRSYSDSELSQFTISKIVIDQNGNQVAATPAPSATASATPAPTPEPTQTPEQVASLSAQLKAAEAQAGHGKP